MKTTISHHNLTAEINGLGAELTCLRLGDKNYIWEGNPEFWGKHSPVLFPIVGTLKNNEFHFDGKTYALPRHGFAREMEFKLVEKTERSAVFSLSSNESTKKVYPFEFEFQILYSLTENALEIGYRVVNKSNDSMYFSIGAHPAFALPLAFENYSIQFERDENPVYHLLENDLLSEKTSVIPTQNKTFRLNYPLFERDALIFKNLTSKTLTILEDKKPYLKIDFKGFPHLGIWTKINAPFICIEPWFGHSDETTSNGNLIEKTCIQQLAPNNAFTCAFSIEIL